MTCEHFPAKVIDSRPAKTYRYRRYFCSACDARWTTVEVIVPATKTRIDMIGKVLAKLAAQPTKTILLSKTLRELFQEN